MFLFAFRELLPDALCVQCPSYVLLKGDGSLLHNGDKFVPVARQARTHDDGLAEVDGCGKALALGEQHFQVFAEGGLVALGNGDNSVKLVAEFLINLEFFKRAVIHADFAKVRVQPDHNGRFGKPKRQRTQPQHGIANGLAARDDGVEKDVVPTFGQDTEHVVFLDIAVKRQKGRRAVVHNDVFELETKIQLKNESYYTVDTKQ